jgi:hypothetical protein
MPKMVEECRSDYGRSIRGHECRPSFARFSPRTGLRGSDPPSPAANLHRWNSSDGIRKPLYACGARHPEGWFSTEIRTIGSDLIVRCALPAMVVGGRGYKMQKTDLEQFQDQEFLSLETFRRNGIGVRTPVWFAQEGDSLYIWTVGDSGKIKRIRTNPRVNIAPCKRFGKVTGEWVAAETSVSFTT